MKRSLDSCSNQEVDFKRSKHVGNSKNIQITDDTLFDMFLYLERKDIEKSRLVSKQWNYSILVNCPFLPLQRFKSVVYSPAFGRFRWNILNSKLSLCLESLPSKIFEISFFEEICFYMRNLKEVENFMKIIKSKRIKLEVKLSTFIFYWGEKEEHWTNDERWKCVNLMHTILEHYINSREVWIKFNIRHYIDGTSTLNFYWPSNLKKIYETIYLDIYRQSSETELNYHKFEESFLNFIENCGSPGLRVDIVVSKYLFKPEIGAKIVRMFMNNSNPKNMFYSLGLKDFLRNEFAMSNYVQILEEDLEAFHAIRDDSQKLPYRLKREDGWTMSVDVKNAKFC